MSEALANLLPLLEQLSSEERAEIIGYLVSIGSPVDDELDDEAFLEELERRGESVDNGTARLIPADKFLDELRAKFP